MNPTDAPVFSIPLAQLAAWMLGLALVTVVLTVAMRRVRDQRAPRPDLDQARAGETRRQLTNRLAHELRQPLHAIIGHAELIGAFDPVTEVAQLQRSRELIAHEASRLARLVEDFLIFSRLDAAPAQMASLNLTAVAEEALSIVYDAATAHNIRLELRAEPRLPRVLGDRDRLKQVFVNLLDNAIKYGRAGGEAIVYLSRSPEGIQVAVCDDGPGIAQADLPHIFEPLARAGNVAAVEGSGLGLAIVREILAQHGATIVAESALGEGTSFRFTLPLA